MAALGEPVRLERGEYGQGRDRGGRREWKSAVLPEGRRGDPGFKIWIQAVPGAEVAALGPWEGACGPLTDT